MATGGKSVAAVGVETLVAAVCTVDEVVFATVDKVVFAAVDALVVCDGTVTIELREDTVEGTVVSGGLSIEGIDGSVGSRAQGIT